MYQNDPTKPLGRRRSISAARHAEVFRQHYATVAIHGEDASKVSGVSVDGVPFVPVDAPQPERGRKAKADK